MADIEINEPFKLIMNVIEFDDHIPSIKFSVKLEIKQASNRILCDIDSVWFQCSDWDLFIDSLSTSDAVLSDMSHEFVLTITSQSASDQYELSFSFIKQMAGVTTVSFNSPLNEENLDSLKRTFWGFAKWW